MDAEIVYDENHKVVVRWLDPESEDYSLEYVDIPLCERYKATFALNCFTAENSVFNAMKERIDDAADSVFNSMKKSIDEIAERNGLTIVRDKTGLYLRGQHMEKIGTFDVESRLDVTDPCYNKDVKCRATVDCKPGTYYAYVEKIDGRVTKLMVYLNDKIRECNVELNNNIGVDSGMCGFFNDKPDYNDLDWMRFCTDYHKESVVLCGLRGRIGVVSPTNYGDGTYELYSSEENDAFEIRFI